MRNHWIRLAVIVCALICPALAYAQTGNFQTILLSGGGIPLPGTKVAVCTTGLTTTAASVTNNIATLTMSSNPITAGFLATKTLTVSGFTGGDTYYNNTFTISAVSATAISFALTHANASAATNGKAFQTGDATTACAPLTNLFTDDTGTVSVANPTTSDSIGNVSVWASPGSAYNVQYYGQNVPTKVVEMSIGVMATGCVQQSSAIQYVGCGSNTTVQAAINALPGTGGLVVIPAGSYVGPTSIPNNNITLRCASFLGCTFTYTANVTFGTSVAFLDRLSLDGIIFDFGNNAAGLILHGTRSGYFAIKIQNSTGAGLTQIATSPNNNSTENDFAFLQMNNVAIGLVLNGDSNLTSCGSPQNAAGAVYLNNYELVDIENVTGSYGIQFTSGADSNTFLQTYILMGAANTAGNAIISGSRCPTSFGDVELEHFVKLTTDAINAGYVGPFIQQNYSGGVIDDFLCGINCTTANSYAFNATATAARGPSWRIGWMGANPFGLAPQPFIQTTGLINNAGLFQRFLSTATAGANFAANPLHFQSSQWNGATAVISDWSLTPSFVGAGVPTFENLALSHSGGLGIPYTFLISTPIQLGLQNVSGNNTILLPNPSTAAGNTNFTGPVLPGTAVAWVGAIDLTAQTANIGNTTAFSVPATGAGLYRVSIYAVVTSPGTTSSLPTACILWTDKDSNGAPQQIFNVTSSGLTNATNTTATAEYGTIVVNSKASVSIAYNFGTCTGATAYASTGAAMQYAVHIKIEALL